ncbi:MAG: hypothetical protein ACOCY0_06160 [Roseicyclus sp.]
MQQTGSTLHLHIGLPKTATTFLQESVFPRIEGLHASCTPEAGPDLDPPGRSESLMAWALARSPDIWRSAGDALFPAMLSGASGMDGRDVLVSDERIGRTGSRADHLGAHLRALAIEARRRGFKRVTCLCAVRRQDLWYASHYAQISDRNPDAGQKDFEAAVGRLVDPERGGRRFGRLLRYDGLRAALVDALGAGNVLVCVYETMRETPDAFAADLATFLGRPVPLPARGAGSGSNVRNVGGRSWALRRYDRRAAGENARTAAQAARATLRRLRPGAPGSIELTPELSERILTAYRASNLRLARDIDADLARYGYC